MSSHANPCRSAGTLGGAAEAFVDEGRNGSTYERGVETTRKPFTKEDLERACSKYQHETVEEKAANMAMENRKRNAQEQQDRILLGDAPAPQMLNRKIQGATNGLNSLANLSTPKAVPTKKSSATSIAQQLQLLEQGLKYNAKQLNQALDDKRKMEIQLEATLDEVEDLSKEKQALQDMIQGKSHDAGRILELQKELCQAEEEYGKIVRYNEVLRHMETRLRDEEEIMRQNVTMVSSKIKEKDVDVDKCKERVAELKTKLLCEKEKLERFKRSLSDQEEKRNMELATKANALENAQNLDIWQTESRVKQAAIVEEGFMPGNSKEEKDDKLAEMRDLKKEHAKLRRDLASRKQELEKCNIKVKSITQETNTDSLDKVIAKLTDFNVEKKSLVKSKLEATERHRQAKIKLQQIEQEVASLRANCGTEIKAKNENLSKIKKELGEKVGENQALAAQRDVQAALIADLQKGARTLYRELKPLTRTLFPDNKGKREFSEHDAVEMLKFSKTILDKMMEAGLDFDKKAGNSDGKSIIAEEEDITTSLDFYNRGSCRSRRVKKRDMNAHDSLVDESKCEHVLSSDQEHAGKDDTENP